MFKLKKSLIIDAFDSAKKMHPKEFMCFLSSTKNIIDEIILFPTQNDENSASINLNDIPFGVGIIGSLHSHPNNYIKPSNADLNFFKRYEINIIIGTDFWNNYKVFDKNGKEIFLELI